MAEFDFDKQLEKIVDQVYAERDAVRKKLADINRRLRFWATVCFMRGTTLNGERQYGQATKRFYDAVVSLELCMDQHRSSDQDKLQLATYLTEYGLAIHKSGEVDEEDVAKSVLTNTLNIREEILGPDHPDTLKSRANLALLDSK